MAKEKIGDWRQWLLGKTSITAQLQQSMHAGVLMFKQLASTHARKRAL